MANPNRANVNDILRLLGDVDATTVERILETEGSLADLETAYFSLMGDDRQEGQLGPLSGKASAILDILLKDPLFAPVDDR